ncbi:hypothetical protein [Thermoanaerobacter sp. A7A]|uniref:hypothetical protein n=1 Tax=Thermoanaerobacter sp. A7A TaxID=1350366 RepID=UPI0004263617|nr:hypothetical protein [Thermoanaerobacter sp. A7A]
MKKLEPSKIEFFDYIFRFTMARRAILRSRDEVQALEKFRKAFTKEERYLIINHILYNKKLYLPRNLSKIAIFNLKGKKAYTWKYAREYFLRKGKRYISGPLWYKGKPLTWQKIARTVDTGLYLQLPKEASGYTRRIAKTLSPIPDTIALLTKAQIDKLEYIIDVYREHHIRKKYGDRYFEAFIKKLNEELPKVIERWNFDV